jgi:hypothetical protein
MLPFPCLCPQARSLSLKWPMGVYSTLRKLGELCMGYNPHARPSAEQVKAASSCLACTMLLVQLELRAWALMGCRCRWARRCSR